MKTLLVGMLADGPAYLKSYDVNANDGRGADEWTMIKAEALRFDDFMAAMAAWKTQSTVRPIRPDGRPNRPLTAYTVTFEQVDQ